MGNCKNCKYWSRDYATKYPEGTKTMLDIGQCSAQSQIRYWHDQEEAAREIKPGTLGCENLYTHQDFGCVQFEQEANG